MAYQDKLIPIGSSYKDKLVPLEQEKTLPRKVFDFFTSSTQSLGQTAGQALAAPETIEALSKAEMARSDIELNRQRAIREGVTSGRDVSRLQATLTTPTPTIDEVLPATQATNAQLAGQTLGTILEASTGGVVSGLARGTLARTTAKALAQQATRTAPIGQRAVDIARRTGTALAQTAPFGYAADVALGLQAGETPTKALTPGLGTAVGVGLPLGVAGAQLGRRVARPVLEGVASNLSGVERGAYRQVAESGRDLIGTVNPKGALLDTRASLKAFDTAVKEEWRDSTEDIIKTFSGKRIGLNDKEITTLRKVAKRFGFEDRIPANLSDMSAKETIDLLEEVNAIPAVKSNDDPLVRSMKLNLADIKASLRNSARQAFGGEGGKFDKLYENYTKKIRVINDMKAIVGDVSRRPNPVQITTYQNRLMSIFKEDRDAYINAIKMFEDETGERILDKVAASQLSPVFPKSLRTATGANIPGIPNVLIDLVQMLTLPFSSPRVGSWLIDTLTGSRTGLMTKLLNTSPKVRTAIYNAVANENMSFDDAVKLYAREAYDTAKSLPNKQGGFINPSALTSDIPPAYKETGALTTKILKDLEGKTTVSKQYILDATNRGELKQVERDLIRQALEKEGATVNVADFAKKVKAELLPLKVVDQRGLRQSPSSFRAEGGSGRYESIVLTDELRGSVKNYKENIYESPISTSAGNVHFPGSKNYFGHTRIEDMADNKTRRVIEVQSDLYQKGRLEGETPSAELNLLQDGRGAGIPDSKIEPMLGQKISNLEKRQAEIAKLQQYNDPTAHFRMVREEIKKASQDGKTKLQFPTGETAMKIEGLGGKETGQNWAVIGKNGNMEGNLSEITPKIGMQVERGDDWIITDVLGDGKFKAVPKNYYESVTVGKSLGFKNPALNSAKESFDISGKVDTNNPIYKFYEKEMQKYLNKFGGKRVVDDKGVSWFEIPITKEQGKMPVEAFGLVGLTGLGTMEANE